MTHKKKLTMLENIKLIVFDVDGVLTDGKKAYGLNGEKLFKSFGDIDFTAIKILKTLGFSVIWLSGDEVVNKAVAKMKCIPFHCTRQKDGTSIDKVTLLPKLQKTYSVSKEQIWFLGDDIFDLNIIRNVGFSSCPANASFLVKNEVSLIHKGNSGENIASEVLELIMGNLKLKNIDVTSIYEIQNLESLKNKK